MKFFISYSRDDKAWVYELWRNLRDEGHHDAWIDQRLIPASEWWESILEAIENCECFLYVMTPKAVDSIYCTAELEFALALNKPILPLMLKPCSAPDGLQKIQFQTITDQMSLDRVLFIIERSLGKIREDQYKGKYAPQTAKRPAEPQPNPSRPQNLYEVFALAEEAAHDNPDLAEKHFRQIIQADPTGLGLAAQERLREIKQEQDRQIAFENILQMAANPRLQRGALAALRAFTATYGADATSNQLLAQLTTSLTPPPMIEIPPIAPPPPQRLAAADHADLVRSIIGGPFEWCEIPMGQVTLVPDDTDKKESHLKNVTTFEIPAFWIAKYPVTNSQFEIFMRADGYDDSQWWSQVGWEARLKGYTWDQVWKSWEPSNKPWQQPRYWEDKDFNSPDQPIVGISFWESLAFGRWLTAQISPPVGAQHAAPLPAITLPTEQQWQRAAQGDDGRAYPWGNTWEASRCNNNVEKGLGKTTPVQQYQGRGDSPFGVCDMTGNVWEWCSTIYETGQIDDQYSSNIRVLRGGSWRSYNSNFLRVDFRVRSLPHSRYYIRGARFSCSF